jgi:hypothetical protein
MEMAELIRAKVARILNSRELAITVGSKDGVVVGMYFDVLDSKGEDITDPDSGAVLGSIDRPKVRVQVTAVQEGLSVASTFKKKQVNLGGRGLMGGHNLSDLFLPPKYVTKYETLKTDEKTWEDLSEAESYVKTGDRVVQVPQVIVEIDAGQSTV